MRDKMSLIGGTLLLLVVIASMSLFTVDQRHAEPPERAWESVLGPTVSSSSPMPAAP